MSIVQKKNCRLVTKGNLDGVVCAVLLKHLNIINDVIFIQPTDIKSEKVQITCNDIMAVSLARCPILQSHSLLSARPYEKNRISTMHVNQELFEYIICCLLEF